MSNGNLTRNLRVVCSTLIALTCVVAATIVVVRGEDFNPLFWMVTMLAAAGVAGEQIATVVIGAIWREK